MGCWLPALSCHIFSLSWYPFAVLVECWNRKLDVKQTDLTSADLKPDTHFQSMAKILVGGKFCAPRCTRHERRDGVAPGLWSPNLPQVALHGANPLLRLCMRPLAQSHAARQGDKNPGKVRCVQMLIAAFWSVGASKAENSALRTVTRIPISYVWKVVTWTIWRHDDTLENPGSPGLWHWVNRAIGASMPKRKRQWDLAAPSVLPNAVKYLSNLGLDYDGSIKVWGTPRETILASWLWAGYRF